MIDHVSVGTHRLDESIAFYSACLSTLGYKLQRQTAAEASFGPNGESIVWLYPVPDERVVVGQSSHVALKAGTPDQVIQFQEAATLHGGATVRLPGKRPDISPEYFGTVITDLDGHTIEVVHWSESPTP